MKNRANSAVVELRQVIDKLVPLLAGKGLRVTQRGSKAFVRADPKTLKPILVNIPNVSDNASDDFIRAIQGFIDHEVAHVLITDWTNYGGPGGMPEQLKVMSEKEFQKIMNIHNMTEDTMIEKEIVKIFPGSRRNIGDLRRHFLEKVTKPALAQTNDPEEIFSYILVPAIRALAGHPEFQDFMDDGNYWENERLKSLIENMKPSTLELLAKAENTVDTYVVAAEIYSILYKKETPEPDDSDSEESDKGEKSDQPSPGDCDENPGQNGESSEDQENEDDQEDGEDGSGGQKGDEEDESENNDSGSEDEGESSEDDGDEEESQSEPGDEDGDEGDGENSGESDAPDGDEEETDGDGSGSDEDADGEEQSDDADGEDSGEQDGDEESSDSDDTGDDDGESGSGSDADDDGFEDKSNSSDGNSSDDASDGDGDEEQGGQQGQSGGDRLDDGEDSKLEFDESGKPPPPNVKTDGDVDESETPDTIEQVSPDENATGGVGGGVMTDKTMFDYEDDVLEGKDLGNEIMVLISKEAESAIEASDWSTFSTEWDRIEPLQVPKINPSWIPEMEEEVMHMTGRMQKDIERIMASQSHSVSTPGHKRGRLHGPSLWRVSQNDPRVFTQKQVHRSKDTAVTLLVDNSGSMKGNKMTTAMISAYALSATLNRVKIVHEMIGFTTGGFGYSRNSPALKAVQEEYAMSKKRIDYDRVEPLVMPIYKSFEERLDAIVKARIAYAKNAQQGLWGNIDGESLMIAASRLALRPESRKVIMVLSDGQPAGGRKSGPHLKGVARHLDENGFEVVGIGIQTNAVEKYYENHVVLNNLNDLPGQVMQEIKSILL